MAAWYDTAEGLYGRQEDSVDDHLSYTGEVFFPLWTGPQVEPTLTGRDGQVGTDRPTCGRAA